MSESHFLQFELEMVPFIQVLNKLLNLYYLKTSKDGDVVLFLNKQIMVSFYKIIIEFS